MNNPASTPKFPVPSFNGASSDASPEEFLVFLRNLISQYLDAANSPRILAANKDTWTTVIVGLTDHLLASFPLPGLVVWHTMQEKITMMETTLEVIQRVFSRVDGIYSGTEDLVKKIFARLLSLCRVLDLWMETEVPRDDSKISPTHMKEKAFQVLIGVLRGLGGNIITSADLNEPSWKLLRSILIECLQVCNDLMSRSISSTFPATVILFDDSHLQSGKGKGREVSEPDSNNADTSFNMTIDTVTHVPIFLALILDVMIGTVSPSLLCQWFLADLVRRISETCRTLFEHCSSPLCPSTSARRAKVLMRIVSSVTLLRNWPDFCGPVATLPYLLLHRRLSEGSKTGWDDIDPALAQFLESQPIIKPPKADVIAILKTLRATEEGNPDDAVRCLAVSYLRSCVPHADHEVLQAIKDAFLAISWGREEPASFLDELEQRLKETSTDDKLPSKIHPGNLGLSLSAWRQQVRTLTEEIVAPDQVVWMDEDDSSYADNFTFRALDEISERFKKPLSFSSAEARISLAQKLGPLACLLSMCDGTDCLGPPDRKGYPSLNPGLSIVVRLIDGNDGEVTPGVKRAAYSALGRIIKHREVEDDPANSGSEFAGQSLLRGIADGDRSVRLAAGYALGALVYVITASSTELPKLAEFIFAQLYRNMESAKNSVRETLLITVGSMGKTSNAEVLGQVLCLLVAQLGRQNPVIKGAACMQLLTLAKYHKKTPYSLMLPYMDQVAPFLVSNICAQPSLLAESCRLISIAPANFIAVTLPHTLPQLFSDCKLAALEAVAKELETKPSSLLVKHSHEILAHIFLLPRASDTTKALNFVLKVLTDATQNKTIDIQSVVKSCLVSLLAELVIVMGNENPTVAETAVQALGKIQKVLAAGPTKGRALPTTDLGTFLKNYMLGLITSINDMLQDVQGKKNVRSKRKILRSLGSLVTHIGPAIANVAPQIMATFQTMVSVPELAEVTLDSWRKFLVTLGSKEVGPHVGPTSAAMVSSWDIFTPRARELAALSLNYIIIEIGRDVGRYLDDVVDLSGIHELRQAYTQLMEHRSSWTPKEELQRVLERSSSDNLTVAVQSLGELKKFMLTKHKDLIQKLASGDFFDPLVGQVLAALFSAACRDGDGTEALRPLAFECIGILGALDPDRCEIPYKDPSVIVLHNFTDEGEAVQFAIHLINNLLVGAFRSTSDIKYQGYLAYSIQELLRYCQFQPNLVAAGNNTSVPLRVRNRWNSLPKHVLETVTPLLGARFKLNLNSGPTPDLPIYPSQSTYREWIQIWTAHLITRASGTTAQSIFGVFRSSVHNKDVVVAHHLLPHLILNILISGTDSDTESIRSELMIVLEDQISNDSQSTADKKLLSAQVVFMLLDHLNKWIREVRQHITNRKVESKRARANHINDPLEEQLLRLDSVLSSIDQNLMAKAAFQCKAFARSLMNFERQIVTLQERSPSHPDLPDYYERLHEIYAHLDEPDGMEGVSTLILSPSLEHQIRQHESTGRWTAAQSCWEVRLQQSPDNVDFHRGLLRCLRNLGHYDTLRTHVRGVLTRKPEWELALADFQVESAWMVGAWDDVYSMVQRSDAQTSSMVMARVLLAMRSKDTAAISESLSAARSVLGAPITASGVKGYRRAYDAVLDLHLTHELELIHNAIGTLPAASQDSSTQRRQVLAELSRMLAARLDATLPTFRSREPILSMRRTAFALSSNPRHILLSEIGRSWLASAKIARKASQWQTAYSAMLQAQQSKTRFSFIESAKLIKATDQPLRALQELENSMKLLNLLDETTNVLDLTVDSETQSLKAKAQVLRARWMNESERFDPTSIFNIFKYASDVQQNWESAHFYLGQFQDQCYKALPSADKPGRGMKMNLYTVRSYARAIKLGSKYVYQTVPRLLTIWLDLGEDRNCAGTDIFRKLNEVVSRAIKEAPVYKWFTAFPQIVSRVGHSNPEVYKHLSKLIAKVMAEYPKQALWLFTSVVKSTKPNREQRGKQILDQLRSNPQTIHTQIPRLIAQCVSMSNELLALCDAHIDGEKTTLNMSKDFPRLAALGRSDLIIPLQESLTASLPPTSSLETVHQPFPPNAPTFHEFFDEVNIMHSLAKPRKITIRGSDGQVYMFLGKPKDDLRKDARLMDFNAIINKLLKANSDSRKRQLRVRTYGVVTLNEECGFIQWVPNTIPVRPVLVKYYDAKRIRSWSGEMSEAFRKIKDSPDKKAAEMFVEKILPLFPPVFHEWFIETFPEPTAWLASRLAYGRTAAVMSMVGFILGLGDRHCENILLDTNTGDVVHVDFNCLFEKGKTLETPERVPFRLTQNLTDGLGVTGVEGVFRVACEVTMQLLRDNKDSLMSVLDAFIHDPLVEWEDEKRKLEREPSRTRNHVKASVDLRMLARGALNPIEKKLKGIYSTSKEQRQEKEISTSNLVQMLIQEATDHGNLSKMYPGWAPWH